MAARVVPTLRRFPRRFCLAVWPCGLDSKPRKCDLLESEKSRGPSVLSDFSVWIAVCVNCGHIPTQNVSVMKIQLQCNVEMFFPPSGMYLEPSSPWTRLHLRGLRCWVCSLLFSPFCLGLFKQSSLTTFVNILEDDGWFFQVKVSLYFQNNFIILTLFYYKSNWVVLSRSLIA